VNANSHNANYGIWSARDAGRYAKRAGSLRTNSEIITQMLQ